MNYLITVFQLRQLLEDAASLGAQLALSRTGQIRPYLNKSQAFRRYGRKNIERWLDEGLLTPRKDGDHSSVWRIDLLEAETISRALKSLRYF